MSRRGRPRPRERDEEEDYGHYGPQRPRAGLGFHQDEDKDDDRELAHLHPALQLPPGPQAPAVASDRRRDGGGVLPGFVRARAAVEPPAAAAIAAAAIGDGECPGDLYLELIQRAPEAEEVVVLGDDEVQVIEAPPPPPPRAAAAAAGGRKRARQRRALGREDAAGVIVLDSDDDEQQEALSIFSWGAEEEAGPFFCEVCNEQVASMPRRAHERTTLHVFNARKDEPLAGSYNRITLPQSNRGVRILERMGWDAEAGKGLGREGQGRVEPAKSMLKLDRRGLGHAKQPKARVTHFPAHSAEEAARAGDGKSAAQRRVEEVERLRREGAGGGGGGKGGGGAFETAAERARRLSEEKRRREKIMRELNAEHEVDVLLRGPKAAGRVDLGGTRERKRGRSRSRSRSPPRQRRGGDGDEEEEEEEEEPGFGRAEAPRTFWPT